MRHSRAVSARRRLAGGAQTGIALILVLWVLSLLTIMALGLTMAQRSESALTHNQIDAARFRALADGAVNLAVLQVQASALNIDDEGPWQPDGSAHRLQLAGETIEIRVFNEASRIDLNQINRTQLAALLELAGAEAGDIDTLADSIIDWRDADQLVALNGAEDDTYLSEGYGYGAADRDFQSVDELQQVRGMTPELFRALEPDLRVRQGEGPAGGLTFGGSSTRSPARFNEEFASPQALAAMRNLTLEDAEALVAERQESVMPDARSARPRASGGPEYRIRVSYGRGDAVSRALEVLVEVTNARSGGFDLLWRREGILVDSGQQKSSDAAD